MGTFAAPAAVLLAVALPRELHWAKFAAKDGGAIPLQFQLHALRNERDAQLIFFAGAAWLQDVVVRLPFAEYLPNSHVPVEVESLALTELFRVESEPTASVSVLVLPRDEVKVGRTGIWRPRKSVDHELSPELCAILQGGRCGILDRIAGA